MIQNAVRELCALGAKLTDDMAAEDMATATRQIDALMHPLSLDDIGALISLLPDDGNTAAGLNWSILHAIEAAPDWPLWSMLDDQGNEWIRIFRLRLANAGIVPPS